jgi:cell wall-associated NlpC family hydrolase
MADKRLTAARSDLAAAHLKGQVEAVRFVTGETFSIRQGRASLRVAPSAEAAQDSELLWGEAVTVYERKNGWAWVQAVKDLYVGYVQDSALTAPFAADARICAVLAPLFSAADIKAPLRDLLPLNAQVQRGRLEGDYHEIAAGCFVHYRHLTGLDEHDTDFVAVAERFIGVPYVWGGKSFAGLDCSGLIQTALQSCGIACPRDTDMQQAALGETISTADLQRGDLVFWKGHVGVMQNPTHLLHANGFHMQVASELLVEAVMRIEKAAGPVSAIKRL